MTNTKTQMNPLLEQMVHTIRNPRTARPEFRTTLEKIGEYLGLEIAAELETEDRDIKTPLGEIATQRVLKESPILISILRAGVPLYNGLQKAFPYSEAGFIGAMRDEKTLKSKITYLAIPRIQDKTVILADTMIATGGSIVDTLKLLEKQNPRELIIAGAIASQPGLQKIREYNPQIKIYTAAIDPCLNEKGYIVPGLGDAGDRAFGCKEELI